MVIWITGLSGAGKSSLARRVQSRLRAQGQHAVLVDGDAVRAIIADPHIGYDRASRLANAYRIARLAHWLESQECLVVVATVSLFHELHEWNRAHFRDYREVYLETSTTLLHQRHPQQLYAGEQRGDIVGREIVPEFPREPHLQLNNDGDVDQLDRLAQQVVGLL